MSNITFRVISTITIVLVIILTVFATVITEPVFAKGIKPPKPAVPITATLITDAQGLGDYAFNDAAVVGLALAEKNSKQLLLFLILSHQWIIRRILGTPSQLHPT